MKPFFILAAALFASLSSKAPATATVGPLEWQATSTNQPNIDSLVFGKLKKSSIQPVELCPDAVFLRRSYLDVIGTLPTAYEAKEFLARHDKDRRAALIDRLLERDEFADYWSMKWDDRLRIKAEFPINLWPNAAQAYHHWVRAAIRENKPYDQFARELLLSNGSNFREPPVNFYRALQNREPAGIAQTVALTFMGVRAEKWPGQELAGLAAFFSQLTYKTTAEWKEEIVYFDPAKATNNLWRVAAFPQGGAASLEPERDPREVFAAWLLAPNNPWFARNIANQVWFWLMGRGIIHEPDDIGPDNPPSNPELLAFLEHELVASHYNLKELFRLILLSRTYQLACIPADGKSAAPDNFAHYLPRRLEAEVLIDALNQITSSTEKYSSPIPEPFTFLPEKQRAIALPDGSISSPFLELFGRPSRDTGLAAERNDLPTAAQELHLLNSNHILRKLEQSHMIEFLSQKNRSPAEVATGLYLGILSRFPTSEELKLVEASLEIKNSSRREATVDLAWALINSAEFLYRH